PKLSLEPNEAVQLTMTIDTTSRRDKVGASSFIEYRKRGENGITGRLNVLMSVNVDPDFEVVPKEIVFAKGKQATRELRLIPHHAKSLRLKRFQSDRQCLTIRSLTAVATDSAMICSVTYNPKKDYPDNEAGTLTIDTDSVNQPILC